MNKLIFFFLILPNLGFGQLNELYSFTLNNIKNSEEFAEFANGRTTQVQVMSEVIPFSSIGFAFFDKLQEYTGTDYHNNTSNNKSIEQAELRNLSDKKKSILKLFFSPIDNEVIMAELVYARSKNDKGHYSITNFGQSLVFIAKYQKGQLVDIKATLMHNN